MRLGPRRLSLENSDINLVFLSNTHVCWYCLAVYISDSCHVLCSLDDHSEWVYVSQLLRTLTDVCSHARPWPIAVARYSVRFQPEAEMLQNEYPASVILGVSMHQTEPATHRSAEVPPHLENWWNFTSMWSLWRRIASSCNSASISGLLFYLLKTEHETWYVLQAIFPDGRMHLFIFVFYFSLDFYYWAAGGGILAVDHDNSRWRRIVSRCLSWSSHHPLAIFLPWCIKSLFNHLHPMLWSTLTSLFNKKLSQSWDSYCFPERNAFCFLFLRKAISRGWRDGLVVKSTGGSPRWCGFDSLHPHVAHQ